MRQFMTLVKDWREDDRRKKNLLLGGHYLSGTRMLPILFEIGVRRREKPRRPRKRKARCPTRPRSDCLSVFFVPLTLLSYSTLSANAPRWTNPFRASNNSQKQPPIYFGGAWNVAKVLLRLLTTTKHNHIIQNSNKQHIKQSLAKATTSSPRRCCRSSPKRCTARRRTYTRLVPNSAPTWSSSCCFTARHF